MVHMNPNSLSWAAFFFAVASGVFFFYGGALFLILALLLLVLNAFLDALDGKVAKLTGRASVRGDFLDHVLDRYADVFILSGIALGPFSRLEIGFFAVLGVLLTSYMGTQAQAVGAGRHYGGALGRADRLVLLFAFGVWQLLVDPVGQLAFLGPLGGFSPLEWLMLLFAVVGNLTAAQRAVATWAHL
jgi:archaetidylinositol phosphate synthase